MRLVWSAFAITDRDEFTNTSNPRARVTQRWWTSGSLKVSNSCLTFLESGRAGRVAGTRECVVPRSPYIAADAVTGDVIRILRILHGAQRWPEEFTGSCNASPASRVLCAAAQ